MRFLIRLVVVTVVLLIAIGLYRGWFSVLGPKQDVGGDKVKLGVSVDMKKVKGDVKKVEQKISNKVEQYEEHSDKEKTK